MPTSNRARSWIGYFDLADAAGRVACHSAATKAAAARGILPLGSLPEPRAGSIVGRPQRWSPRPWHQPARLSGGGEMRATVLLLILMACSHRVCVALQVGAFYTGYDIAPAFTCNVKLGLHMRSCAADIAQLSNKESLQIKHGSLPPPRLRHSRSYL